MAWEKILFTVTWIWWVATDLAVLNGTSELWFLT